MMNQKFSGLKIEKVCNFHCFPHDITSFMAGIYSSRAILLKGQVVCIYSEAKELKISKAVAGKYGLLEPCYTLTHHTFIVLQVLSFILILFLMTCEEYNKLYVTL